MTGKSKLVKVLLIIVAIYLLTVFVNVLLSRASLSNSRANQQSEEEPVEAADQGRGGGIGSGGGYSVGSGWQSVWVGPLCWANTDICW